MIIQKTGEVATDFRAAGCFCVYGQDVLVMQRQRHKAYALHWAIPTGKIEVGETARRCMERELREELGLMAKSSDLIELNHFIIEHDDAVFEYVAFVLQLDYKPHLFPNTDEVRKVEWVNLRRISKRRVVPYFYDTVQDLLDWTNNNAIQGRLFPAAEATSAERGST